MQKKLGLIQVFRGFAAISVVLFHILTASVFYFKTTWLNGVFSAGSVGVDFFFVLSGFIMMYIHYGDLINRSNVKAFFLKRFIRIYPIYWIIASVYLFFQLYTGKYSIKTNLVFIIKSYLLIPQAVDPFLFPAWSLIFECFFYIIFGTCLLLGIKWSKYVFAGWLLLILIGQIIDIPFFHQMSFSPLILEFLFGCFIGYIFHTYSNRIKEYDNGIFYSGLALMVIVWILGSFFLTLPVKKSLWSCMIYGSISSLLILGSALKDTNGTIRLPNILLLIGESSYTIYLSHQIVLGLVYKKSVLLFSKNFTTGLLNIIGIIAFILAVIVGIIFHEAIEKKLLPKLQKWMLPPKKLKSDVNFNVKPEPIAP